MKYLLIALSLFLMSIGLSSCYVGIYHPGPRFYRPAPRYRAVGPPRYYHPPVMRPRQHPHYHGPRYRR